MKILQNKFINDPSVLLLSHSVTLEKDNVQVLKEYAIEKGCVSGKLNDFLHTENFILVNSKRRIQGVYNGTLPIEMDRIIEDIIALKKEKETIKNYKL